MLTQGSSLERAVTASQDAFTDLAGVRQRIQGGDNDESLKEVAQQFESMFINILLKNMRSANAVFEEDSLFQSQESQFYRDMHDNQLSLTLAQKPGLGIADMLYKQMKNNYGSALSLQEGQREPLSMPTPPSRDNARVAIAEDKKGFIDNIMPYLHKAADILGVEKEMLAAQAALETGWGKFVLANEEGEAGNNLFNIKQDGDWQGKSVAVNSLEEYDGVMRKEESRFKVYSDLQESVEDYVNFVQQNPRYEAANQAKTSEDYIKKLHEAGYATDSRYADKIIGLYKQIKNMLGAGQ